MQVSNSFFKFKQFIIHQCKCAMKVTTDGCLFGAWSAGIVRSQNSEVRSILDIGAGTGLLSLMLAQQSNASIDTVEIDNAAAVQTKENVQHSPFADRITVFNADVLDFSFSKKYDVIISNPPFYENELKSDRADRNIAHHNDGLLLNDLLQLIKGNLHPDGKFLLLLPYKRKEEVEKVIANAQLAIIHTTFVRQSVTHNYFRMMIYGGHVVTNPIIDEISICKNDNSYTDEFAELLKPYYLML